MNANEFRIGNILYCTDTKQEFELNVYGLLGMVDGRRPAYEPIKLSPEILEKCGFEFLYGEGMNDSTYVLKQGKQIIFAITDSFIFRHSFYNRTKLTSLHQLQNLYFALCGEELTYKK